MLATLLASALLLPGGAAAQERTTTKRVVGGTITLRTPRACVRRGATSSTSVSFRRVDAPGNAARRITRVELVVAGTRKVDRSAPFRRSFRARGAADPLAVLARVRLALRSGSATTALTAPVDVCG